MPADQSGDLSSAKLRPGVRLALDWGSARIGVAACDRDGLLCYPVETITADSLAIGRVQQLIAEYEPIEIIFGWPIDLRGVEGPAVEKLRAVVAELAQRTSLPIRLVDERLSSAQAGRQLAAKGISGKKRRAIIDQAAAVEILQQALAEERLTGNPAGRLHGFDR